MKQESAVLNPLYIGEIKLFSHKRYLHILLYIAILNLSSRLEEEQREDSFWYFGYHFFKNKDLKVIKCLSGFFKIVKKLKIANAELWWDCILNNPFNLILCSFNIWKYFSIFQHIRQAWPPRRHKTFIFNW